MSIERISPGGLLTSNSLFGLIGVLVESKLHAQQGGLMPLLLNSFEDLSSVLRIIYDRVSELPLRVMVALTEEEAVVVVDLHVLLPHSPIAFQAAFEIQNVGHVLIIRGKERRAARVSSLHRIITAQYLRS